MAMIRKPETSDEVFNYRHNRYLKNKEAILQRAKERYQEDREVRLATAQKIRNAAREARLLAKRQSGPSEYQRKVAAGKQFLTNYKKDKPCLDCGVVYPPFVLDFDHVRGNKASSISDLVAKGASLQVISKEISKCDLVCANCHRVRTFSRRTPKPEF